MNHEWLVVKPDLFGIEKAAMRKICISLMGRFSGLETTSYHYY
jgi:hypothetical protein